MKETYKIQNLEQVRLLSDPLKLRLIQAFAEAERTTKDVSEAIGEPVTKLYRHVDALHDAGLLEVTKEQRKRGTIERTFRAVAQRFEADHSLFNDEQGGAGQDAARDMLRISETEILNVLANARDDDEEKAIIMRIRGKATREKIAELRQTLQAWLESVPNDDADGAEDGEEFGGLVAFYEIDEPR